MNATDDGESRADELSGEDAAREVVLVTGISGSGKSVALHALGLQLRSIDLSGGGMFIRRTFGMTLLGLLADNRGELALLGQPGFQ